jgi:hypothetical protein
MTSDIYGDVTYNDGKDPPPAWWLYIHTEILEPYYEDFDWHYEANNTHYNTTAYGGNGTYRITAELRYGGVVKARGSDGVVYSGTPVREDINCLPIQPPE